jgi:hypothetical protein
MNDFDLDPTADDLAEVVDLFDDLSDLSDAPIEEDDFFADDGPIDDRWSGDGIPSWSAWSE